MDALTSFQWTNKMPPLRQLWEVQHLEEMPTKGWLPIPVEKGAQEDDKRVPKKMVHTIKSVPSI